MKPGGQNEGEMNAQRIGTLRRTGKQEIFSSNDKGFELPFSRIVNDLNSTVRQIKYGVLHDDVNATSSAASIWGRCFVNRR